MPRFFQEFLETAEYAIRIYESPMFTWEEKFNLIFSEEIKGRIDKSGVPLEYHIPDTSYKEDVRAYMSAVKEMYHKLSQVS